jgi:sterol 14alpha-demethylase
LPVLGHIAQFIRDRDALFRRGFAEHGEIFSIRLPAPVAIVAGPQLNRWFYSETDKALNISKPYKFLKAAFGNVLFTASKEQYDEQRSLLKLIFSNERMRGYLDAMNVEVDHWLAGLGEQGEVDITAEMQRLTQYVAGRAFLGPNFRHELGEDFWAAYVDIGRGIDAVFPAHWPLPKFRRRDKAKAKLRAIFAPLCEQRSRNPSAYDDVVSILVNTPLSTGRPLDREEVISLWTGLLWAGHETTAGQAAWSIILTLQHEHVRRRFEEHVRALPSHTALGAKELRSLELAYNIVDETTRLRPSADLQLRVANEPIELAGYNIPKGWRVMVTSAVSHHLSTQFQDPARFDPDRFAAERGEGKESYAVVGFGGGRHKCTGMTFAKNEMAIILTKLFRQYDLELVTQNPEVVSGVGANRPAPAVVRYRKREELRGAH